MPLLVLQIPALRDNYMYLIRDTESSLTGIVDPSEAAPVLKELQRTGWPLNFILNTHHHPDHTGGNLELKQATGAKIVGPRADKDRIPGVDILLGEGESFELGHSSARVFDVPGHTKGHIAFWFNVGQAVFTGDTLFTMGCGRLFEGTPEQMWASLSKLRALPGETMVYCGHEYTAENLHFAVTVDGDNPAVRQRMREVIALRAQGKSTVPARLELERATNPFLRADDPRIKAGLKMASADPVAVFAEIRRRKDQFRQTATGGSK